MFQIILIIIFVIGDIFIIKEYYKTMRTNKFLQYRIEYIEKRLELQLNIIKAKEKVIYKDNLGNEI